MLVPSPLRERVARRICGETGEGLLSRVNLPKHISLMHTPHPALRATFTRNKGRRKEDI
ncbi:hypothetical protein GGD64_007515 [Bradyrhizobium sp. CIR3A]|nr:hypothetical protein [Bradyrhizobium sp. CIR3A]